MQIQKKQNKQTGVTMIEILVAIVVFSVGLSGMTAMVLNNVRTTSAASARSEAVILADQIAEAMRTNMVAYETGSFTNTPATTTSVCAGSSCDAATMSQYDADSWQAQIAKLLPAGQAIICVDSTPDDGKPGALACDGSGTNVIKIFWNNSHFTDETQVAGTTWRRLVTPVVP